MKRTKLIPLTQKEASELRVKLYKQQLRKCAILKKRISLTEAALDHKHKLKKEKAGKNGGGLIRGIIHIQVNSFEGVVYRKYKKYGLHKLIPFTELLRNLADYLDNPPCPQCYIHPNEREKVGKLNKTDYKRIIKYYQKIYPNRKKLPEYPKSGKLNNTWKELLEKVNKIHFKGKNK